MFRKTPFLLKNVFSNPKFTFLMINITSVFTLALNFFNNPSSLDSSIWFEFRPFRVWDIQVLWSGHFGSLSLQVRLFWVTSSVISSLCHSQFWLNLIGLLNF
ncbi:hypothetical protein ERO13_D06G008250v2 [Gossypium hirsutum]|uniref:Uncharacterized protein n=4 Tax=Gossypium TaxID=3633 RepID=A0A0D2R0A2_GOSRA|nr:hypothetical protein ES319_D06G010800v1 [Gossypium barbadense]KAG4140280.1 hypothetical protein ERO13_D06G008250v2 [Gossypium hirsutum]KJB63692.1 hypothetical protein B456_010G011000 [Gossypium raimondii]TYG63220.1 hypothetical protein ES288_D06G011500v1 [Gossypium darwinii]TYH64815.1 hypothetical protein ES332_D06G012900v1 [Gossypium tomentosum]